jgi:hypothetical protein
MNTTAWCERSCWNEMSPPFPLSFTKMHYPEDFFLDRENIAELKSRSVRKQFFYEYLMQKYKEREGKTNEIIKSSFWLPQANVAGNNFSEMGAEFMGGYIHLKNIDFMKVTQSYLSS